MAALTAAVASPNAGPSVRRNPCRPPSGTSAGQESGPSPGFRDRPDGIECGCSQRITSSRIPSKIDTSVREGDELDAYTQLGRIDSSHCRCWSASACPPARPRRTTAADTVGAVRLSPPRRWRLAEISSSTSTSGTSVPGASGVNSAASVGSMKWVVACECPSSNVAVTLTPPAHRRVECG